MKLTLLEIVMDILSDMDSDEVNSIFDTTESEQVAQIVKSSYMAMMSNRDWPHQRRAIQLNPYSDPGYPTHMKVQDEIKRLVFINYNCARAGETRLRYMPIHWREPEEFLQLTNQLNSEQDNVDLVTDPTGVQFLIQNDRHPTYFTSFDDVTLIFNSYDKSVDDTLQNSKVQAQAYVMPQWSHEDSFIPDLPVDAFTALQEEAKSRAMVKLKQMEDPKAEGEARRQQRWLARNDWRVKGGIEYPNYGRRGRKAGYRKDPTFRQGW
tara:strand:+ start:40416 stop:41210 length:795 start_codon:yes stop_codon:yes gene_type:complete